MTGAVGTVPLAGGDARPILLCLSHLRWDFVYQRPQHLLTRAAKTFHVVFVEEPVSPDDGEARLVMRTEPSGVVVVTPHLPPGLDPSAEDTAQRHLLDGLVEDLGGHIGVLWFYTPMAFAFAGHIPAATVVFDSMDQLSAFRGASPRLLLLERQLMRRADIVFAGGRSLEEAKRRLHGNVHLFPSSVDEAHFRSARSGVEQPEPPDQAGLARPRVGYFGVIDERLDYALLDAVAALRPGVQFVMVGPTAKVDPAALPRRPNLHWLGKKDYTALPHYLAGWDAGMMPFALNEATRFISPTKTPEFLAAGVPVISTAVPDVVADWQADGLVAIVTGADEMAAKLDAMLAPGGLPPGWLDAVDRRIQRMSWDATWSRMNRLIDHRAAQAPAAVNRPDVS